MGPAYLVLFLGLEASETGYSLIRWLTASLRHIWTEQSGKGPKL